MVRIDRDGAGGLGAGVDWTTIASLATAGGTLVLALATFAAVRSATRSARLAEYSMKIGSRSDHRQATEPLSSKAGSVGSPTQA